MADRVATRYWLAQIPGWFLAGFVLGGASLFFGLPGWAAVAGVVLFVVKDIALYPLSKRALESPPHAGSGALVGSEGVVDSAIPAEGEGRVKIGAEVWRARLASGAAPLGAGDRVRIEAVDGLVVRVTGLAG